MVTAICKPFFSMVIFMEKWAIAAIPAFLILIISGVLTGGMLGRLLLSLTIGKSTDSVRTLGTETPTYAPIATAPQSPIVAESAYLPKLIVGGQHGRALAAWYASKGTLGPESADRRFISLHGPPIQSFVRIATNNQLWLVFSRPLHTADGHVHKLI